jgi:hypothetical protein
MESSYQKYKKFINRDDIKLIRNKVYKLRTLLKYYNERSPNFNTKKKDINDLALEIFRIHKNYIKLKDFISQLNTFIWNHTKEFKEMQNDFYEITHLLEEVQTGDIVDMNVAIYTPFGNIAEKLTSNSRKRQRVGSKKKTKKRRKAKRRKN